MKTIGFILGGEIGSLDLEKGKDWVKEVETLRKKGAKILYVYHVENHRPVFDYKGETDVSL